MTDLVREGRHLVACPAISHARRWQAARQPRSAPTSHQSLEERRREETLAGLLEAMAAEGDEPTEEDREWVQRVLDR